MEELINLAKDARMKSYSPYTKYSVGAALITKQGKIYTGCNVENYGIMSICAERVAFLKAISEGEKEFKAIAVVGGNQGENPVLTTPCGYCRQFMLEFVDDDFEIYVIDESENIITYKINDLLPDGFKK